MISLQSNKYIQYIELFEVHIKMLGAFMATLYGNWIFINMYNQFLSPLRYASMWHSGV